MNNNFNQSFMFRWLYKVCEYENVEPYVSLDCKEYRQKQNKIYVFYNLLGDLKSCSEDFIIGLIKRDYALFSCEFGLNEKEVKIIIEAKYYCNDWNEYLKELRFIEEEVKK